MVTRAGPVAKPTRATTAFAFQPVRTERQPRGTLTHGDSISELLSSAAIRTSGSRANPVHVPHSRPPLVDRTSGADVERLSPTTAGPSDPTPPARPSPMKTAQRGRFGPGSAPDRPRISPGSARRYMSFEHLKRRQPSRWQMPRIGVVREAAPAPFPSFSVIPGPDPIHWGGAGLDSRWREFINKVRKP